MRWAIAAVIVAVAAAIAVNALLLDYGTGHTDPVGQLSPVADLPAPTRALTPARVTTTPSDNHGSVGRGADD